MNEQSYVQCAKYKIVFVGDIAVGKTSIINQFSENKYKDIYDPSIGVDFASKTIKFRGRYAKLQIWDTAGQEKYKSLIPSYIRGSTIIYIVYDITNRESFDNISNWITYIEKIKRPEILVLCGNKIDNNTKRIVSTEEAERISKEYGMTYYETSAKENVNINKLFYDCIGRLDFFDDIRDNYKNIGDEIEYENIQYNDSLPSEYHSQRDKQNGNIVINPIDNQDKGRSGELKKGKCGCK